MIIPRIESAGAKHLRLAHLDPVLIHCLGELPEILAKRDSPAVRDRLFPDLIAGNDKTNADWHQYADTELHHLFASAGEIVARDLTGLTDNQVTFPAVHLDAWLNALNQARLILAELHHITETDMATRQLDPADRRHHALLRIYLFGDLLHLLVTHAQGESHTP